MLASHIFDKTRRLTTAYQFAKRLTEVAPQIPEGWINYGRLAEQLYLFRDAERAYAKGLKLAKTPHQRAMILINHGAMCVTRGDFKEAERLSRLALELDPQSRKAAGNLGIAYLAQGKWAEGWVGYQNILGSEHRKLVQYGEEPIWQGAKDQIIAVYGEQGLGDEIAFASMLPDAIKDSGKVIVDCDKRLEGLFRRSFPQARVYGTRNENHLDWAQEDRRIDASISMGGLGQIYRRRNQDFPGTPYLTADPERVLMWRALWAEKRKPVIGLAWTGGVQWTAQKFRTWKPQAFSALFGMDAHFVSLQYKDASQEIVGTPIVQYPHATLTKDYDDTAALVASLDQVICMQTAVAHLAGGLGVKCRVFLPDTGQWRYGIEGDSMPWYTSLKVYRQNGDWEQAKAKLVRDVRDDYAKN